MANKEVELIKETLDALTLQANTVFTLEDDPNMNEEDKMIMYKSTSDKIDIILEKFGKGSSEEKYPPSVQTDI